MDFFLFLVIRKTPRNAMRHLRKKTSSSDMTVKGEEIMLHVDFSEGLLYSTVKNSELEEKGL